MRAVAGWRPTSWLALIVRVALAVPLILYGLAGADGTRLPATLAMIVAGMFRFLATRPGNGLALAGGGLLLLGLATRSVAILLVMLTIMSRQMLRPFWPLGLIDIAITMLFFLVAQGGGVATLDQLFARRRQKNRGWKIDPRAVRRLHAAT